VNDDMIHIIPAEEQSAEEVAEIFAKVAEAQGLQDEVHVEDGEVLVPKSLNVTFQGDSRAFPPVNQVYQLQEPVKLYAPDSTVGEEPTGVLEGFGVVVNQSS
jgi:hypothetical protein